MCSKKLDSSSCANMSGFHKSGLIRMYKLIPQCHAFTYITKFCQLSIAYDQGYLGKEQVIYHVLQLYKARRSKP